MYSLLYDMKFYYLRIIAYIGILLFLASCSTTNTPKPKPLPKYSNKNVSVKWINGSLVSSPKFQFVPMVEHNVIFTADSKGYIFKIDATDGTIINTLNLRRDLSSGVATSADSIFVTTLDGYLLSVNKATGTIKWQAKLPTVSVETPQIGGDTLIVRANNAEILAYNVDTGSLLWVYQKQSPLLTLRANNTFQVVGNEVVLAGQPGGRLVLLNLQNGNVIWENFVAIPEGATDLDKITDIAMRPVINDKLICVATFNGKITCLDAVTSNITWSKKFSSNSGILIDEEHIYSTDVNGIVYAFDKNTGAIIWKNDMLEHRSLSAPAFLDKYVLVIDNEGNICLFNHNDGKLVTIIASDLRGGISLPWSNGKKVIVQSANGYIAEILK